MKKIAVVFAIVVLNLGMVSCDSDASVQDDKAYVVKADAVACEDCEVKHTGRD